MDDPVAGRWRERLNRRRNGDRQETGQHGLVAAERATLDEHVLDPLGVTTPPGGLAEGGRELPGRAGYWERRLR
jgi:hypothetical protein